MSIAINQQEAGRAAFETWRDEIEPDGWGEGLRWDDLHPNTQQPWVDLARVVVEKWNARRRRVVWRLLAGLLGTAYLLTIVGANWAIAEFGSVPVWPGLTAPAAVVFAGLAFTLRDLLHKLAGRWAVAAAIGAGAGLSFAVASPGLAVASAVAFGASELADMAVYEPLRRRRWLLAVALSNVVGLVVDSWLFLWLAFGSLAFFWGQVVGKGWMTLLAIAMLAAGRWAYRRAVA